MIIPHQAWSLGQATPPKTFPFEKVLGECFRQFTNPRSCPRISTAYVHFVGVLGFLVVAHFARKVSQIADHSVFKVQLSYETVKFPLITLLHKSDLKSEMIS